MRGPDIIQGRSTIILPTYEEVENISPMISKLTELYPQAKVLVVDDDSEDGTPSVVRDIESRNPQVKLLSRRGREKGLTASIIDGVKACETEFFVVMDADFQHPPHKVASFLESLSDGHDMTIGVRRDLLGLAFFRRISSSGANGMANTYLWFRRKPRSNDVMSGFFGGRTALWQDVLESHERSFEKDGFKALFDFLKFAPEGIRIDEVPFDFGTREGGESKLDSGIVLSILKQCGLFGRGLAELTDMILLSMMGRFSVTLLIAMLTTLGLFASMGGIWHPSLIYPTFISFILALVYVLLATEFLMKRFSDSGTILGGAKLMLVAISGYLIVLYMFNTLSQGFPAVYSLVTVLGFGLAFTWDLLGSVFPKGSPS